MGERVDLVEVSPRDGLQNEAALIATEDKLALIDRARAAGLNRIEAASFVNPKKVPQMADAEPVMAGCLARPGADYSVLALNLRGLERALAAGAREINYVFVASETFSIRNNGAPTFDTLQVWPEAHARAREAGVKLAAVVSAAFGCPFEGEVPIARVMAVTEKVFAHAPDEFALADTIGVGVPSDVKARFAEVAKAAPKSVKLRAHFHDTRKTGVANALTAFENGVTILDGSLGGVGGCPFAPGAAGNVATEDLVYAFQRSGVETGVDLDRAIEAARWILDKLGRGHGGAVARAGGFPRGEAAARVA
ncbi:MAG: hydroxymethylglutaryl-CoA lyase [Alphaproteobacteria bacterium]|nr:hydroxymethylglutaryl-CoA lyase [Alphaproteobacteria bacterium]